MIRWLAACVLWAGAAQAACEDVTWDDIPFTQCSFDHTASDLRLFLYDDAGTPIGQFGRLEERLADQGLRLRFAMNAGMYHDDRSPVGHYVEEGREEMRVVPNAGPGNFGLLPNGIYCIRPGRADVFETQRFLREAPECRFATQSGPMLVIDGKLHPRFLADGSSTFIRNGVGTSVDGRRSVFAISNEPVNFHTFARYFRDALALPNALFFDGNISRLYAPDLNRSDFGFPLGPMVGAVEPLP